MIVYVFFFGFVFDNHGLCKYTNKCFVWRKELDNILLEDVSVVWNSSKISNSSIMCNHNEWLQLCNNSYEY